MKVKEFVYRKSESDVSKRQVFPLIEKADAIEGLDLSKFSEEEINELDRIQEVYIKALEPFFRKGYRRFNLDKIEELHETTYVSNKNMEHG